MNWFWVAAFVLNDFLLCYMFYNLWLKNFGMHMVTCEGCGELILAHRMVTHIKECGNCHVCVDCGKYLTCDTCGKRHLVQKRITEIHYCEAVGCFEEYELNEKKKVRAAKRATKTKV